MGYYTAFKLEIFEGEQEEIDLFQKKTVTWSPEIEEAYKGHGGYDYAVDENGECIDQVKWYDYRDDMLKHSKKYPCLVFKLSGEGEDSGDIWCEYFQNGKFIRYVMPKWDPPEFDVSQLT